MRTAKVLDRLKAEQAKNPEWVGEPAELFSDRSWHSAGPPCSVL